VVFSLQNTVQMYKLGFIENWNLIYEAPYISLLLEDDSALKSNIMPAAIPDYCSTVGFNTLSN